MYCRQQWKKTPDIDKFQRQLGRGGWVATRNYELDSGAYFLSLLWNYYHTTDLWGREKFLGEPLIHDAVLVMLQTWRKELHHESSEYRYAELPREGRGAEVSYTGMSWSGFRPSDDPNTYGYNIPGNMYAWSAANRTLALNSVVWRDAAIGEVAQSLKTSIKEGIEKFGVVTLDGERVYAYEVDGKGGVLADFDDPNVPSLLSVPLLGYEHDDAIYTATMKRVFSSKNK